MYLMAITIKKTQQPACFDFKQPDATADSSQI